MATGTKDGWMGDVMADSFGQQDMASSFDVVRMVVGDLKFNGPEFVGYWERLAALKERGCFNENADSLGTWDARLMIQAEEAAMGFPAMETALIWIKELGPDTLGIMRPPMTAREMDIPVEADVQFITKFAKHPKEAAEFLAFLRTPERMQAMYNQLGLIPADDRFDLNMIEEPVVRQYAELVFAGFKTQSRQVESWLPYEIVGEGLIPAFQKLWAGEVTPQEAADIVEDAASRYRELNPDVLDIFRDWMVELGIE
jgi:multiple sugar transport system substrate-binding protein